MNPFELPKERFKLRRDLLLSSMEFVISKTSEYIYDEFLHLEKLERAEIFCQHNLMDAPSSRSNHMEKVGFFPWVESAYELDSCLTVIFEGNYKSAFDSLRRAIELIVVGSFFVLDSEEPEKAKEWMKSKKGTPNFKRSLDALEKSSDYYLSVGGLSWKETLLNHYWRLCDIIHVKGIKNSSIEVSPRSSEIFGISPPIFEKKACFLSLSCYVKTVELIALTLALTNPILLVGFDIDGKFGLNPPISGFYDARQAENLYSLIPEEFRSHVDSIKENDENIASVRRWLDSIADVTEEDLASQSKWIR